MGRAIGAHHPPPPLPGPPCLQRDPAGQEPKDQAAHKEGAQLLTSLPRAAPARTCAGAGALLPPLLPRQLSKLAHVQQGLPVPLAGICHCYQPPRPNVCKAGRQGGRQAGWLAGGGSGGVARGVRPELSRNRSSQPGLSVTTSPASPPLLPQLPGRGCHLLGSRRIQACSRIIVIMGASGGRSTG